MSLHTVYLTTPALERKALTVEKVHNEHYALRSAQGLSSLEGMTLAFSLEDLDPEVQNLDFNSDSYSCFARSEHLKGPELEVKGFRFTAKNLSQVQSGLDRLRGDFIDCEEF